MAEFLKSKLFYGIEAEGPDRGKPTLFVSSWGLEDQQVFDTIYDIDRELEKLDMSLNRVYFGAGGNPGIPAYYIPMIEKLCDAGIEVVIEIDHADVIKEVPIALQNKVKLVLSVYAPESKHITYVKIVDKEKLKFFHEYSCVAFNDRLFGLDVEIIP